MKINLQFFGGRGASSSGAGLGGGSGVPVQIGNASDVWSFRHRDGNAPFVDAINQGIMSIQNDFPDVMNTVEVVNATELLGKDKQTVLGFWDPSEKTLHLNDNYVEIEKMNKVYDASVASGYHPSRGNLTGTQAVAMHEMGHALTDHIAEKMGFTDPLTKTDKAAQKIVDAAYRKSGNGMAGREWAGTISGYAKQNNAEAVAEAVADWYSNGSKSSKAAQAIMAELKKYR